VSFEVKKRLMSLYYRNEQTGAEARFGRTGAGFYVEVTHPDFSLPLRKTYQWFQQDLATRDFDILRAVVGATREQREPAVAS
jgi:hypothetical protein